MSLPVSTATRSTINVHLSELLVILQKMNHEIKSPFDERVQDALTEIAMILGAVMQDE